MRALLAAASLLAAGSSLACHSVVSSTDAAALGYGPPAATLAGYDEDPVPRPRVTGWTPPAREAAEPRTLNGVTPPSEPVPHSEDVRAVCSRRASLGDDTPTPTCLRSYRIARLFRSLDKWKGLVACVDEATSLADATGCERQHPAAFELGDEHPREQHTCLHVLALSIIEDSGPEPMMSTQDLLDIEPIVRDCVRSLVEDEREDLGPKRYFELLDCFDAAETLDDAEACE